MGIWLLVFEKAASVWCCTNSSWFLIASQVIILFFSGSEAASSRTLQLFRQLSWRLLNLVLKPGLILGRVISLDTLEYLGVGLAVIWEFHPST